VTPVAIFSIARRWAAGLLCLGFIVASGRVARPVQARDEVRALWVGRTSLTSPQAIEEMAEAAKQSGFNTLLVQVRGLGDSYFLGGIEPRPAALAAQPAFDPLATAIAKGHERGLSVHAWINVNLVAGTDVPASRSHIAYRHPEWLMVPRALARDLSALDPTGPEYLGRLTRYARAQVADLEGLYLSPVTAGAVEYTKSVVRDIVQRYAVDGVHFDYVRYPNEDFDYSRETLGAFRHGLTGSLSAADIQRYDARVAAEPLFYTEVFREEWRAFRIERLTTLVSELRQTVKAVRPSATVSATVGPDAAEAAARRLQDWERWMNMDLLDVICPAVSATDVAAFASQIATAQVAAGRHGLWAGIGANRLSSEQTIDNILAARRLGASGVILFSYDSLIAPARASGYLTQLGKAAFSSTF
jgi:uncharacterized lipoprotein YddW (UPF0748 family)